MTNIFDCDQTPVESMQVRQAFDRREDWHTPETCFKLLDVQSTVDSIFKKLEDGDVRMGCMEDNIAGNHRIVSQDIKSLEIALSENTAKTNDIYEILEMGRGFFKGVAFIGKWTRRIIMKVAPPITAVLGLWYAIKQWPK